ncbi:MAG: Retron-type reverse transcriptase [Verrucomicrobiaceae bacterium]|nr:Retron-type reverse transcriptase [Verrucomicrobiaceae bacterium]
MQPRLLHERYGAHARAILNLVVPLAYPATAKRITETAGKSPCRSRAVSTLIGASLRCGDVNSMTMRSTQRTTRGIRTSMMATRTTTTRTTSFALAQSADSNDIDHAGFLFEDLLQAYFDCRRSKRNSSSALAFEINLERNLVQLHDELIDGTYKPGRSICFVVTRPKPREVWAADFRDRIVHHLLYNKISPRFYASFIADSCACIPTRGTLYAATRLESKIRSASQNWSKPTHYLKCDLANFFVSIDKNILIDQLTARIPEQWWLSLTHQILFHDPRTDYELRGNPALITRVPPHKRLTNQAAHLGLPIGNLSSQFFANVFLDALDQFVKHQVPCRHYVRYVDDFVLLHESPQWLTAARDRIDSFLHDRLHVALNPRKTILQPINRGVDFVGHVIKPWRRTTRRRSFDQALKRVSSVAASDLRETANSYFGLLGQASHSHTDRQRLAKIILRRGRAVNFGLTKTFAAQEKE